MNLNFDKRDSGEVFVQVEGRDFATKDYIEMIKQIKEKDEIEATFSAAITEDERSSIQTMIEEMNSINVLEENEELDGEMESDDMDF